MATKKTSTDGRNAPAGAAVETTITATEAKKDPSLKPWCLYLKKRSDSWQSRGGSLLSRVSKVVFSVVAFLNEIRMPIARSLISWKSVISLMKPNAASRKLNRFTRCYSTIRILYLFAAVQVTHATASEVNLAFLGPRGTYSEVANEYASRVGLFETSPMTTITQIAQSVVDGSAQYGLLPFENSIAGFVGETHRLLTGPGDLGWRVIADVTIPISNNLMVRPGTNPSALKKIVSHPEALKESASWLKANFPDVPQEGVSSTAAAAEAVLKGDGTIGAIASPKAADVYHLQVLFANIQDDQRNATTFLVTQAASRDFLDHHPTRLIVRCDTSQGGNTLTDLVEALHRLSFTLTEVDSASTGKIGSYRFALILDSDSGENVEKIYSVLRPVGASLIGAYRPPPKSR
jgi:prephenate dehydratase